MLSRSTGAPLSPYRSVTRRPARWSHVHWTRRIITTRFDHRFRDVFRSAVQDRSEHVTCSPTVHPGPGRHCSVILLKVLLPLTIIGALHHHIHRSATERHPARVLDSQSTFGMITVVLNLNIIGPSPSSYLLMTVWNSIRHDLGAERTGDPLCLRLSSALQRGESKPATPQGDAPAAP